MMCILSVVTFLVPVALSGSRQVKEPGEKINRLLKQSFYAHRNKRPQECIKLGKQALELAKNMNDPDREVEALMNIAEGYILATEYENALEYFQNAIKRNEMLGKKMENASALNSLGGVYNLLNHYDIAIEYYRKALRLYEERGDKSRSANTANNIGMMFMHLGILDKALEYYLEALKKRRQIGDNKNIAATLNNIGLIYLNLEDFDKASEYFRESLELREKVNDKRGIAICLNNIGEVYLESREYTQGLTYLERSLNLFEEIGIDDGIADSLNNIGSIYYNRDNYDKALDYYWRALSIRKKIRSKNGIAITSNNIGKVYLKQGKYTRAIGFFKQGLRIAKDIGARGIIQQGYDNISQFYAAIADYKKSLQYYKRYSDVKESISTEKSSRKIAEMQASYEIEKKEKENERLRHENKIRRLENRIQAIIAVLIILGLVIGLTLIYKYYRHLKNELTRKNEIQKRLELESKLKLFQSRINPHFLFNTLDAISGPNFLDNPGKLQHTVQTLSNMYRKILYLPEHFVVLLKDELEVVRDYLEIEKRRLGKRLDYRISVDEELLSCRIMPLSIETLVENAVIHGICPGKEGGSVNIYISNEKKYLAIKIKDTGVGFEIEKMNPGFGLYSVQERLKLFYNNRAKFRINSFPGEGTEVIMEVPHA